MLDLLEKIAEEQSGSKAYAQAFVAGFVKEAAGPKWVPPNMFVGAEGVGGFFGNPAVQKGLAGIGAGIAAVALTKGINTASGALTDSRLRAKFEGALRTLKSTNRIIKTTNEAKVNAVAETIFRFAPNIASDANLLGPVLSSALMGEGLDPMTMKSLVDLEGRYKENGRDSPLIGFKLS